MRARGCPGGERMAEVPEPDVLRDQLRASWQVYLDLLAPIVRERTGLYRVPTFDGK